MFNEVHPRESLKPEQLQQIQETGKFTIPSKKFKLDYKYKINSFIHAGKQNRMNTLRTILAFAHKLWIIIGRMFSKGKCRHEFRRLNLFVFNIWSALLSVAVYICSFLNMLIGFPLTTKFFIGDEIKNAVEHQTQKTLLKGSYPENFLLSKFFQLQTKEQYEKKKK